jgi:tetratricopeptide (TPR) repeat protein
MRPSEHPSDLALLAMDDGELSAKAEAGLRAHLAACAACSRARAALLLAREHAVALGGVGPGPFARVRARHRLVKALEGEPRPAAARRSLGRVPAAVGVLALSGAALAVGGDWGPRERGPPTGAAVVEPTPVAPVAEPPAEQDLALAPESPPEPPAAPLARAAPRPARALAEPAAEAVDERGLRERALAAGEPTNWLALGDFLVQSGALPRGAAAYGEALRRFGSQPAGVRLSALLRGGRLALPDALAELEEPLSAAGRVQARRLRCEWGLAHRGDRAAVEDCRTFGRAHPDHPAAPALAFGAGRLAEIRLHDLPLAVAEYSRALLVADAAGVPSPEALFARARARAALGDAEEARADLRLYLHVAPEARHRDEVRALATALELVITAESRP